MTKYIILLTVAYIATAHSATEGGGGGIVDGAKFTVTGREAIGLLSIGDSSMDYPAILQNIRDVKVIPTNEVCEIDHNTGGLFCEDAHFNSSNRTIKFNINKWKALSCNERLLLSSHELLRAAGLEGEDYFYSGRFMTREYVICRDETELECADKAIKIEALIRMFCKGANH